MGRLSTKENKTLFQLSREELGYSRDKASELLDWISAERIEKIENEKSLPHPDEVLAMSVTYNTNFQLKQDDIQERAVIL